MKKIMVELRLQFLKDIPSRSEFCVKMNILFFDEHLHNQDYLDWEQVVETLFKYIEGAGSVGWLKLQ